jgi:light-independent protochlorophyllide reductase subunit B
MPVVPLELPSYSKKENWGASETLYHLVRTVCGQLPRVTRAPGRDRGSTCSVRWRSGFRHRDDVTEADAAARRDRRGRARGRPARRTVADLVRLPEADLNVVMYPELGATTASWLQRSSGSR